MRNVRPLPWISLALGALVGCATASSTDPVPVGPDAAAEDIPPLSPSSDAAPDAPAEVSVAPVDVPMADVSTVDGAPVALDVSADRGTSVDTSVPEVGPSCGGAQVVCAGECVTTATDARHCGGCGQACAPGERCEAGVCRLSCPSSQAACMGGDGVAQCVTLATDRDHCGMCNSPCTGAQTCVGGRCVTSCPAGQLACLNDGAMVCADLQRDARNCGMCNAACLPTESCVSGACRLDCPAGQTACSGRCRDLTSDNAACGACTNACAAGQGCVMGRCVLTCPTGQTVCAGACVNTATDARNCGACGTVCGLGMVCTSGSCALACRAPTTPCSGVCVNTTTDARNCGACANACPSGASATATCVLGRCGLTCATGRGNCDAVAGNGCEVDLSTSAAHCGACGRACPAGAPCVMGACVTTRVLEDFEMTAWPHTPWVPVGASGGSATTTCAHDGTRGGSTVDWVRRSDVTVGAVGQRLSAWVRGSAGRFYLGFGADSTGAFSLVFAPNTTSLEVQRNSGYAYQTLTTVRYVSTASVWYRLEVQFTSATTITGTLYAADGTTALQTLSTTVTGFVPRGVAMRSFGSVCADTIELR